MACALALCAQLKAQAGKAPLKIVPVEGDGAFNDIRKGTALIPVVEIRDEYDRRVPNARVVFSLPSSGAGGAFTDGQRELIVATDAQGRAAAAGFHPNRTEGRFGIRVTASADGRQGSGTIWQSNTLAGGSDAIRPGGGGKKKYIILALVGAAAAGGALAATHGGKSGASGPVVLPTTLTSGTITVGGPR